jgi:5-methyltetrahydropteroyltriglutamate--homocysteine methyltransferase
VSVGAHTDHVGSLLRPPELLAARGALASGELDPAAFKRIEDLAVREVIALQESAGCEVVTDGELRRESFQSELTAAVEGVEGADIDAWLWGDWHSDTVGESSRPRPAGLAVTERLRRRRLLASEEFTFLRANTARIAKVTLPSPTLFANLWDPDRSRSAYPRFDDFMADVVALLVDEVRELERLGATYVQLDAPHYPLLIDPQWRRFYEERGWTLERWLSYGIELDNALVDAAPQITFGFHLCRGNQDSRWLVTGAYDAIAAPIFRGIRAQRLLLEYDDERSGSFDALALVPDDKVVVLGLVTTKTNRVETTEELERRIEEAALVVDRERLALGTQCGFATSVVGNRITADDQRRKLELIAATGARLWPTG